jgi:quercetin dioxygenase-like cupin family protein
MNAKSGLLHISLDTLSWSTADVRGSDVDEFMIFEGNYDVVSAFYRMKKGQAIPEHTHENWVQVMVLQGCMRVEQEGSDAIEAKTGSVYFVEPHYPHIETALTDTVVLVTQGEYRAEWASGANKISSGIAQTVTP